MVSGGCHFLSCNDEKRFGEVQEGLLCVLFVSFAPEVQRRATSAGYAHLYRRTQVGGVSGPTSWTCFLPQKGEGFVALIFHSSFATRLCSRVVIVIVLYYSSILVL